MIKHLTDKMMQQFFQQWHTEAHINYLNFAAHGPAPRVAVEAAQHAVELNCYPYKVDHTCYFEPMQHIRRSIMHLINGAEGQLAITSGVGDALSILINGLSFSTFDEVILLDDEFPTHHSTWQALADRDGVNLVQIAANQDPEQQVIHAITSATKVICISHVRFNDGRRIDIQAIVAAAKAQEITVIVDISQSCGVIPIDVVTMQVDAIVCAGYKYLFSPWGCGFLWLTQALKHQLSAQPKNWLAQGKSAFNHLNYLQPQLVEDGSELSMSQSASPFNVNMHMWSAALQLISQQDIQQLYEKTNALIDVLITRLTAYCTIHSPQAAEQRGVCLCISTGTLESTQQLFEALQKQQIIVALRDGRIRIAPYATTQLSQIDQLCDAIINWQMNHTNTA